MWPLLTIYECFLKFDKHNTCLIFGSMGIWAPLSWASSNVNNKEFLNANDEIWQTRKNTKEYDWMRKLGSKRESKPTMKHFIRKTILILAMVKAVFVIEYGLERPQSYLVEDNQPLRCVLFRCVSFDVVSLWSDPQRPVSRFRTPDHWDHRLYH